MKVWIDQDLCTGDGLCTEICPSMFTMVGAVAQVVDQGKPILGMAAVPDMFLDQVLDAAEECPGECIFVEQ
jgi:ferredoxin